MRTRKVLLPILIIAGVFALVAGLSSYAVFTDSAVGTSSQATAGTVDVVVNSDADDAFDVTFGSTCVTTSLAPTEVCGQTLTLQNAGQLSFTYSIEAWSDTNNTDDGAAGSGGDTVVACFNVKLTLGTSDDTYANVTAAGSSTGLQTPGATGYPTTVGDNTDMAATESQQWRLNVTVDDDNACQAVSAYILVRVLATQSSTPRD